MAAARSEPDGALVDRPQTHEGGELCDLNWRPHRGRPKINIPEGRSLPWREIAVYMFQRTVVNSNRWYADPSNIRGLSHG
jgi:hypothetical protein